VGQARGESNRLVGGLYTLWQRTDHVVMFVRPKTKVVPLTRQLPTTTTTTNEHRVQTTSTFTHYLHHRQPRKRANAAQTLLITTPTTNRPNATVASCCSQGGSGLCFWQRPMPRHTTNGTTQTANNYMTWRWHHCPTCNLGPNDD
jgi:hypothetical protein